jgi:hypothetical protein
MRAVGSITRSGILFLPSLSYVIAGPDVLLSVTGCHGVVRAYAAHGQRHGAHCP